MQSPRAATASVPTAAPEVLEVRSSRIAARVLTRRLRRSPTFIVGFAVLAFWITAAVLWRQVPGIEPFAIDPARPLQAPGSSHWFGTDDLGRDVFDRVIAGAASVLSVAPLATALGLVLGTVLGLAAGYYRGIVDDVLGRVIDAFLAFPVIIVAVLILGLMGSSRLNLILVIGILFTPLIARTVRGATLGERERDYVAAARTRGEGGLYIMFREILPNVTSPIVVEGTVRLGYAVFVAATLSFLGLGLQQPSPDWGLTIATQQAYVQVAWWTVVFPALALASLVVAVNLVVDGLRRAVAY